MALLQMTGYRNLKLHVMTRGHTKCICDTCFGLLKVIGKGFSQPIYFLSVEIKCLLDKFVEIRTQKYPPVQKLQGYLSTKYYFSYESDFP